MKNNPALTDFQKSNSRINKLLETYASLSKLITDDFSRLKNAFCRSAFDISKNIKVIK